MPQTTMRSLKLIGENSTPTNTSPGLGAAGSGTSRSSIPSTASPYFTTWTAFIATSSHSASNERLRTITPAVIPDAIAVRNPKDRELFWVCAWRSARHTSALIAIPADVLSERQARRRRKIAICAATATIDAATFAPKVRSGSTAVHRRLARERRRGRSADLRLPHGERLGCAEHGLED